MFLKTSILVMFAFLASVAGGRRSRRHHRRGRSSSSSGSSSGSSNSNSSSRSSCDSVSGINVCWKESTRKVSTGCIVFSYCKSKEDRNCCKALSKIKCMIRCRCNSKDVDSCPLAYNSTPYYQFGDFLSFIDVIPVEDARKAFPRRLVPNKRFNDELREYIRSVRDYGNFDTLVPYLYNVDLFNGLHKNDYDVHYLTWFINSFHLYLSHKHPKCRVQLNNKHKLCDSKTKEELDLICITGCDKCSYACPGELFNKIICSTVNRRLVVEFIDHVLAQIKCCSKCSSRGCDDCNQNLYTTYASYKDSFIAALKATRHIVQDVHRRREEYFGGKLLGVIAAIPYRSVNPLTPTISTNMTSFLLIPETAIDFEKIIDF